jgi:hypothetical protein
MLCTLDPGFMPEGMTAGGKGVLVQAPPSHGENEVRLQAVHRLTLIRATGG